jgi:hypothetical protein
MLLAELLEEIDDLTQPLEVQQGESMRTGSRWEPLLPTVVGPAHSNGRMGAVAKTDHQVRIGTLADTDDGTALTTEGVMRMGDGHVFQRQLGIRGSVLWACQPWRIESRKRW